MPKIERVVTIDDNLDDLTITKHYLQQYNPEILNHDFQNVKQGLEFLKKFKSLDIQMIFIDLYLQNRMKGTDFIDQIRGYTNSVPVVILTGSENETDILEAYKYNICKYVVKPLTVKKIEKLERHVK